MVTFGTMVTKEILDSIEDLNCEDVIVREVQTYNPNIIRCSFSTAETDAFKVDKDKLKSDEDWTSVTLNYLNKFKSKCLSKMKQYISLLPKGWVIIIDSHSYVVPLSLTIKYNSSVVKEKACATDYNRIMGKLEEQKNSLDREKYDSEIIVEPNNYTSINQYFNIIYLIITPLSGKCVELNEIKKAALLKAIEKSCEGFSKQEVQEVLKSFTEKHLNKEFGNKKLKDVKQ